MSELIIFSFNILKYFFILNILKMEMIKMKSPINFLKSFPKKIILDFLPPNTKIEYLFLNKKFLSLLDNAILCELKYYLLFYTFSLEELILIIFTNQKFELEDASKAFEYYLREKNISFGISVNNYDKIKNMEKYYPYF